VRGTDFDYGILRANLERAPLRGFAATEFKKRRTRRGDLIIEKSGGGEQQPVGRVVLYDVDEPAVPTNFAGRLRSVAGVDSRFISYLMASLYSDGRTMAAIKQTTGIQNLDLDTLLSHEVRVPSEEEQGAIADYLDTETAYLSSTIAKKIQMSKVLEERRASLLENALEKRGIDLYRCVVQTSKRPLPDGWALLTLGRVLTQLTNGYVGPTRDILVTEGIRYLQGLHIKRGRIDFVRRPFYVEKEWHSGRPRTSLNPGDVLMVQTGDIGQVAVVPSDFGPANCHALLIARPNHALISSEFLGVYLQSVVGRNELLRLATGALHPHLEFGVRVAPVLVPPLEVQTAIVNEVNDGRLKVDEIGHRLTDQIELLRERRQALITAAVTGELDIPGVAA